VSTTTEPRCGRCHKPKPAHEGGTPEETEILLGRLHCKGYAIPRAEAAPIATDPAALCRTCWRRGHKTEDCPC
jgi:hypothetical protein